MKKHHRDEYEKIIGPIIEGQIKDFLKAHPSALKSVDWYKPTHRINPEDTFINSISKRIIRDLSSPMVRARLAKVLLESCADTS